MSILSSLCAPNETLNQNQHERPPLRPAPTPQISRLHFAGCNHTRARHWDEHGHFQFNTGSFPARFALFRAGACRAHLWRVERARFETDAVFSAEVLALPRRTNRFL